MKIQIDRKICIGSSACVGCAPKTFVLDEDGLATVLDPNGDPQEAILAAEAGCPTQAIKVEEE